MGEPRNIDTVLVTVQYPPAHMERLRSIFSGSKFIHIGRHNADRFADALKEADAAVLYGDLDERFLDAPRLRWVHCDHAGLNRSARLEVFERGLIVTSSAGRSAPVLAEHVLFFALALSYRFPLFYEAQKAHQWGVPGSEQLRGLYGKTIGILGMGHTGKELAVRAKAFGMQVLGYRRSVTAPPPGVDKLYCMERGDSLDELLRESDIVAIVLPLSDTTHRLIGERELKIMKNSALLINLGRGAIIDEEALVRALHEGEIAGAGLDTFTTEPLPKDSPLWDAPNTLITPHCTPAVPDRTARSLGIIAENARRYRAGEPLINQLTVKDMYTKG